MERSEQLKQCKECLNNSFDNKQGLLCKLTNKKADFEETCSLFKVKNTPKSIPATSKEKAKSAPEIKASPTTYCATCMHRSYMGRKGLFCNITNLATTHNSTCDLFKQDKSLSIDKKESTKEKSKIDYFILTIILICHLMATIYNEKNLRHGEYDVIAASYLFWNILSLFFWRYIKWKKLKMATFYILAGLNLSPLAIYFYRRRFWSDETTIIIAFYIVSVISYIIVYRKFFKKKTIEEWLLKWGI